MTFAKEPVNKWDWLRQSFNDFAVPVAPQGACPIYSQSRKKNRLLSS